ncbi:MAG: DUF1640 domain-containing protein [Nitrospinae bacterium]|nr:DUF1640 domain-containing protein [Nitrospinota bacterium]
MGNAIIFDTHIFVKKLQEAGFTEKQAEVLSSAQTSLLEGNLATKLDIAAIQRDIKELETGLKRDMQELEIRLKYDLTLRLGGMMAASIAIMAALVKLL